MTPTTLTSTALFSPATLNTLADALVEQGWYVGHNVIDAELCHTLYHELAHLAHHNGLSEAGIGRGNEHHLRKDIRGDAIRWLNHESAAQRQYLASMAKLQQTLNQALFLGLFEYEAHFAHYPPGAFYQRHVDSFRGRANRVVSTVGYLTPHWPADGGGEMVIYHPENPALEVARVTPEAGTFACFLSATVPHEVLPTRVARASIAGWFRRNASLGGILDPAR
jgi:SM-20-related protein